MKYNVEFATHEIRLTLTESLTLPEEESGQIESPPVPDEADPLPQIGFLARQFLKKFAVSHGGST